MNINIYQIFTRLFRNENGQNVINGDIEQNGCSKFNHFDDKAISAIKNMGYTHVWLTGVIRHASTTAYTDHNIQSDFPPIVKGKAGSPYAIKDYFDVTPDLAENIPNRMYEFEEMVDRFHKQNLKVIIDFVPNHVARQYRSEQRPENIIELGQYDDTTKGFTPYNNFYYIPYEVFSIPDGIKTEIEEQYLEYPAKATGNNVFRPQPDINDWYETVKLNYGVDFKDGAKAYFDPIPSTWQRVYEILKFWADKMVDGFRIDMADMVPMKFWEWVIPKIKAEYPEITFTAEAYQPIDYKDYIQKAQFDWLYDKVQFYNTVRSIVEGKNIAGAISQVWKEQEGLNGHLLRFMENHDEHRVASEFFAQNAENIKPAMVLTATMHTGPIMIYFGQELGEKGMYNEGFSGIDGKTSIFDYWKVESYQKWVDSGRFTEENLDQQTIKLRHWYIDLLKFRNENAVIKNGSFYDLMWVNQHLQNDYYIYFRHSSDKVLLCVMVFNIENQKDIEIHIPNHALKHIGLNINSDISIKSVFEKTERIESLKNKDSLTLKFNFKEKTGYIFELY